MRADYFQNPAISGSDISGITTPVEFYQKKHINKPVKKDYFDIGTAAHAYILEPIWFRDNILVFDDFPEPGKINKDGTVSKAGKNGAAFTEFVNLHPRKIVFEKQIYRDVVSYAESLKQIPGFDDFISMKTGISEKEFYTKDETGLSIKLKPDYIKPSKFICDLKFMNDISDFGIAKSFRDYDYDLRAAFYIDFYAKATSTEPVDFVYIIVKKCENPTARFLYFDNNSITINGGRAKYRCRLDSIARCYNINSWIAESLERFEMPDWVYNKRDGF